MRANLNAFNFSEINFFFKFFKNKISFFYNELYLLIYQPRLNFLLYSQLSASLCSCSLSGSFKDKNNVSWHSVPHNLVNLAAHRVAFLLHLRLLLHPSVSIHCLHTPWSHYHGPLEHRVESRHVVQQQHGQHDTPFLNVLQKLRPRVWSFKLIIFCFVDF